MSSPRNPSTGFWITVALVAVLVGYPLSFGPAMWFVGRGHLHRKIVERAYWPVLCVFPPHKIRWFGEMWLPRGKHLLLDVMAPDGIPYSIPFDGR